MTIRFSRAQLDAVEAAAEALGIERAQFIRMGALRECGWQPKTTPIFRVAEKKPPRERPA